MATTCHPGTRSRRNASQIHSQETLENAARMLKSSTTGTAFPSNRAKCIGARASKTLARMPLPGMKPRCAGCTLTSATRSSVTLTAFASNLWLELFNVMGQIRAAGAEGAPERGPSPWDVYNQDAVEVWGRRLPTKQPKVRLVEDPNSCVANGVPH